MLPAKFAPALIALLLSGMMSLVVSGISTLRNAGLVEAFASLWMNAWMPSWLIAFPVVMVVAPLARRIVGTMVKKSKP
ncbi:MAG TPA: DUF2798 domain-containing protein [Polaromonas sp.]|uniref:DUF2798 domain-containing protein n=1 Tax=Polaromonas sp. TaxID=1869339 RepID=UPI002D6B9FAA|nr:DUF2798 domain-containing protein [Polaromonas sp.]HYW55390.1 DUF2798 domain-containing protein [Polaromonas sp.]